MNATINCFLIKCASWNVSAQVGMTIAVNVWTVQRPGYMSRPSKFQRALARTKHGALILIDKWTLLGDAIDSERGIDEPLRQTAYDLLGIDQVFRHGFNRVPAATDVVGLRALVQREVEKHRLNLERSLNARSESEREMAQMGIARFRDTTTNL